LDFAARGQAYAADDFIDAGAQYLAFGASYIVFRQITNGFEEVRAQFIVKVFGQQGLGIR